MCVHDKGYGNSIWRGSKKAKGIPENNDNLISWHKVREADVNLDDLTKSFFNWKKKAEG